MSFWEVHGYMGGLMFLLFLILLPRLTILFSVSLSGIIATAIVTPLSVGPFLDWIATVCFTLLAVAAWVAAPRYLIAAIAILLYGLSNWFLAGVALVIAYLLFEIQKELVREIVEKIKDKEKELRAAAAEAAEANRKIDEAFEQTRMRAEAREKARRKGWENERSEIDELLRRLRESQAQARREHERSSRRAANFNVHVRAWWEVLGTSRDAPVEAVKSMYRKIARETHPDSAPDGKGNTERFSEATEAYDSFLRSKGLK